MKDELRLTYLPPYAEFLSKNKVKEFTTEQLRLIKELNVPLFKYFANFTDEQLIQQGIGRTEIFFKRITENKVSEYVNTSIQEWLANQIPLFTRESLSPEDITLISFIRRKLFRDFLSHYTNDSALSIKIMEEVDSITVKIDTLCFKYLMELQHDLYEQAQALAHIGNWTLDLTTKKLLFSEELFKIYELEQSADANFYNLRAFIHPNDLQLVDEQRENSLKTLKPYNFYYRIILKDGSIKYLHTLGQVQADEKGIPIKMFGTLQDVTTQKRAEHKSDERQKLIQKIADVTPSLIAAYNIHSGKYIFVNQAIRSLLGYELKDIMEQGVEFLIEKIHPDDRQLLMKKNAKQLELANLRKNINKDMVVEFSYRLRHKNGSYKWFHTYGTVFNRDKNNQVEDVLYISVDITEGIHAAAELEQKNKRLEQTNKELESFSYIASHDLQEPLRKIQAFSSRILQKEHATLSDWGKDVFEKIISSANRMQRLIEALLNFSRLGKAEEALVKTDLNQLMAEAKHNLAEVIETKHATIEIGTLPVMNVIPFHFLQVFTNLLSNALKYNRPDTAPFITVTSEIVIDSNISDIHFSEGKKYYRIRVSDNGIGFDQQYSEKIFELFQRLHGKAEYEGTGIGLAICKKIVENHHGFISAEGDLNLGARFNMYFPIEN